MPSTGEAKRRQAAQWLRRHPEYVKSRSFAKNLRRRFGLSVVWYLATLEQQGGRCAICRQPPAGEALAVDHSHETGEIRGLLCFSCNRGIGMFKDDAVRLQRASLFVRGGGSVVVPQEAIDHKGHPHAQGPVPGLPHYEYG